MHTSHELSHALTFKPDQSTGAGQWASILRMPGAPVKSIQATCPATEAHSSDRTHRLLRVEHYSDAVNIQNKALTFRPRLARLE